MTGRIIRMKLVTRDFVKAHPEMLFVFGDNMAGVGLGGQAKAMRGEPNAIGVPTKWSPSRNELAYFSDDEFWASERCPIYFAINQAFAAISAAQSLGRDVVVPADGLGTGLAELPTRAPAIHAYIESRIRGMEGSDHDEHDH